MQAAMVWLSGAFKNERPQTNNHQCGRSFG